MANLPVLSASAFDHFWSLYPRKVAKSAARKAWAKIDASLYPTVLRATATWLPIWQESDQRFIPHPATWLNGERWEDDIPPVYSANSAQKRAMLAKALFEMQGDVISSTAERLD